jgi:hypothetical protein
MKLHLAITIALASGCTTDPRYVHPDDGIEASVAGSDVNTATAQLTLPVRWENDEEFADREDLEEELGTMVSQVRLPDFDISVEWTIENFSDQTGIARLHLNGANEFFAYVPLLCVVDPDDEEVPPPLLGDIPLEVEPGEKIRGVFREDQLLEAAIDLELITRGGINPFAAVLEHHEETQEFTDTTGALIPRRAFSQIIRLDITLIASEHMRLEYAVRVRDHRSPRLLHPEGRAADPGDLVEFAPADFTPPAPVVP